ncbi:MAG: hypothetical protein HRT42_13020 [Campylobacteraceae bacterium]|nr:hypothetical protein [Campylobacteraceae bacterium]
MKKYLLIILPFLFISCGSDSSKNDDKTNIKTNSENISYEKIFSNNNIEKARKRWASERKIQARDSEKINTMVYF